MILFSYVKYNQLYSPLKFGTSDFFKYQGAPNFQLINIIYHISIIIQTYRKHEVIIFNDCSDTTTYIYQCYLFLFSKVFSSALTVVGSSKSYDNFISTYINFSKNDIHTTFRTTLSTKQSVLSQSINSHSGPHTAHNTHKTYTSQNANLTKRVLSSSALPLPPPPSLTHLTLLPFHLRISLSFSCRGSLHSSPSIASLTTPYSLYCLINLTCSFTSLS